MNKRIFIGLILFLLGSIAALWIISSKLINERVAHLDTAEQLSHLRIELEQRELKIKELEQRELVLASSIERIRAENDLLAQVKASLNVDNTKIGDSSSLSSDATRDVAEFSIQSRIASISKFVPLSEEQKNRLEEKFRIELDPHKREQEKSETLDSILGQDTANFYRERRKSAFDKVLQEEIEKEVLLLSRRLGFSSTEEDEVQSIYLGVEEEVRKLRSSYAVPREKNRNHEILKRMIEEQRLRNTLLAQRMKEVLNEERYLRYLEYQANSSGQEMELWHSSDQDESKHNS